MATGSTSKSNDSSGSQELFESMSENSDRAKNENFYREPDADKFSPVDGRRSPRGFTTVSDSLRLSRSVPFESLGHHSMKPRSLMETLLVAKMEAATLKTNANDFIKPLLTRMDSADSSSSFGSVNSSNLGSEFCRCDDCLLGIVDTLANELTTKKKVDD